MRLLRWILGRDLPPAEYRLTRRVFLALFGLVHVAAFASLAVQVEGLLGPAGIRPATELLERAGEVLGPGAWRRLPTVFWWWRPDALALQAACFAGVALGLLVTAGIAQRWALVLLWLDYLSLMSVGDVFLGYQWDALLLEATLLAALWAPPELRASSDDAPPPRVPLWLLRWLVFRVLFLSGAVKLHSGDPTWADLTALEYHYWTQPLPHALSHLAHHLPAWVHRAGAAGTLFVELALPLAIFGPRRLRAAAAAGVAGLMALILLTGNYGFFEPLVLALCVTLLDDGALRRWLPVRAQRGRAAAAATEPRERSRLRAARSVLWGAVAAVVVTATTVAAARRLGLAGRLPGPARALHEALAPARSFNAYGLFAVMTTARPEIAVEGSADGLVWRPYRFRYKPGALDERPRWALVHMPRLDWQMWFAALGTWRAAEWYPAFVQRLLEGAPEVLALLEEDPFPDEPPAFVRSTVARYTFSSPRERRAGVWWRAGEQEPYAPTFTLVRGALQATPVGMSR